MTTLQNIRSLGWTVAVHNDYRLNGQHYTFWLFTKGDRCAKGEGRTDRGALLGVLREINRIESEIPPERIAWERARELADALKPFADLGHPDRLLGGDERLLVEARDRITIADLRQAYRVHRRTTP